MKPIFVSGIGTGIGKTFISAIICEALKADYWKPIQAGNLEDSDSITVSQLISNSESKIHPETYRLTSACSPHLAAEIDKININLKDICLPKTSRDLVVEGAGGLLVPINSNHLIVDMILELGCQVILVSHNYLGSINHTLLSLEALERRQIPVLGVIFNGPLNIETEKIILKFSKIRNLGRVEEEKILSKDVVLKYAQKLKGNFNELVY